MDSKSSFAQKNHNIYKLIFFIVLKFIVIYPALGVEKLSVEAFASLPGLRSVKLSPDGTHMACYMYVDQGTKSGLLVYVINLETGKKYYPMMVTQDKNVIRWLRWANDDTLLLSIQFPDVRKYNPTVETRLLVLDFKTGTSKNVFSNAYIKRLGWTPQLQDRIVDVLPEDKDHILISLDRKHKNTYSVVKVNLKTDETITIMRSKADVLYWMTDQQHRIRVSIHRDKTTYKIMVNHLKNDDWEELWEFQAFSQDRIWPIGFGLNPNELFIEAYHQGKIAIFKINLLDSSYKKQLVYANDSYDVDGQLVYSKITNDVIGISDRNSEAYEFWDKQYTDLQDKLNRVLPKTTNIIYSFSKNEHRYITLATSDQEPGTYYIGDRNKNTLTPIASRYEKLTPQILSKTKVVHYQARDGLDIEAFLTLPKDLPEKSLPTVIFPHGGPISHDNNGFDYWTQFFVNRGYAVLQMNFRGSSGYGYDFMKQGLQNWGLSMQDDVEDGTRWLIAQGIADSKRICIVGASYGGYAALMGSIKAPGLYQCAISFAGVSDIEYLVKSERRYTSHDITKKQIGDDYSELSKRSPINLADKINIPILLIHSSDDRTVRVKHSRGMYEELQDAGKSVQYLEHKGGDHYLSSNDHRLETFRAMDNFLAKNLSVEK